MARNDEVQAAVVTKLKAAAAVTTIVGVEEVREARWQGLGHDYPNVRVRVLRSFPDGEGPCEDTLRRVALETIATAEDASSTNCGVLADAVYTALHRKQLSVGGVTTGPLSCTLYSGPVFQENLEAWVTRHEWTVRVNG